MVVDEPGQMTRICSSRHFVEPDMLCRVCQVVGPVAVKRRRADVRGPIGASMWEFCVATMDDGRWTMDGGQWTKDNGQWTLDGGRWTVDGDGTWLHDI